VRHRSTRPWLRSLLPRAAPVPREVLAPARQEVAPIAPAVPVTPVAHVRAPLPAPPVTPPGAWLEHERLAMHEDFQVAATRVIEELSGVHRLLLCSSDGLVIADSATNVTTNSSAATAAAVLGLGHHAASMLGHGRFQEAVLRSTDGCLVVHGVTDGRVLAIFCDTTVNTTLLNRKCRAMIGELDAAR
jgi:predicted regulator of Ras-like GTPase activity (Roadblock/LC7/MglB family)